MKHVFSILILPFLFSCTNKKKYEGRWTNSVLKYSHYNEVRNVLINQDSIKFSYPYFEHWHSFPLEIKNRNLHFNGVSLSVKTEKDTLTLNDSIYFIRDPKDTLFGYNYMLKLMLPDIYNSIPETSDRNPIPDYIYFGKRLDNNQFSLQLNDKYAEISGLPWFIASGHQRSHSSLPISFLFIDKDSKMNDLEAIFHEHQKVNRLKINFVIEIYLSFNESNSFFYEYKTLSKRLPPIFENSTYSPHALNVQTPPYPPFPSMFEDDNSDISYFILKENTFFYNKSVIDNVELTKLVEKAINKNNVIISLYDLESNYDNFLKMNAIIDGVYYKKRNNFALEKFNNKFEKLEREQVDEIKLKIPLKHIWSYSIPHYKHILEKNKTFFGLKVKPIDSIISKLDSVSIPE